MIKINAEKYIVIGAIFLLAAITLSTSYYGSSDIGDYGDVAKYFSGDYNAKIRSSHSYLLGYIHAPLVRLFGSFVIFKLTSLLFLALIIISVYYISGRDKKSFLLSVFSPVIWYMAPWINPIQLASLIMLWSFYFMKKYEYGGNISALVYSGLLIGLGWAVWDTMLYFGMILAIVFLYDKKIFNGLIFLLFVVIGLAPRLILDQYLFNFAFFSTIKTFISGWVNIFGGIYQNGFGHTPKTFITLFSFFMAIPLSFWILFSPEKMKMYKKEFAFIALSLILLLMNPQIRYVLALAPIIITITARDLSEHSFKFILAGSILITAFFAAPYFLQISYSINGEIYGSEAAGVLAKGISLSKNNIQSELIKELEDISKEFPNETFLVGNHPDNYQVLAHFYWGDNIREFVSIQDYNSYLSNNSVLYQKRFEPIPNIAERRQFWIEGGLKRNENDNTDYRTIQYGIGIGKQLEAEGFRLEKEYNILKLSKKI